MSFEDQVNKVNFNGFEGAIGWNYYESDFDSDNLFKGVTSIFGLSFGRRRINNLSSLTERSVTNTRSFNNSTSGASRSVQSKQTVYEGPYETFTEPFIAVDWLLIPHKLNKLGVLLFFRSDDFDRNSGGFGLFLIKDKTNYTPKGGITLGWTEERGGGSEFNISIVTTLASFIR